MVLPLVEPDVLFLAERLERRKCTDRRDTDPLHPADNIVNVDIPPVRLKDTAFKRLGGEPFFF